MMQAVDTGWRGVYPVISTPFDEGDEVDHEVLGRELSWLYDSGVQGVTVALASEILRLGDGERRELVEAVCAANAGRGRVIVSVGAESSVQAVAFARHATSCGADAVMAIPPISCGTGPETVAYYRAIIETVGVPLIVQDASAYVGAPLPVSLQSSLLEQYGPDRVMFKPEAPPLGPRISALLEATVGKAVIFDGSGGTGLVDAYRRGAIATMPGPEVCWAITSLWDALEKGEDDRVYRIGGLVAILVSLQSSLDAFIAFEKYMLVSQGVFKNALVRAPVDYVLDCPARAEVDRLLACLASACRRDESQTAYATR